MSSTSQTSASQFFSVVGAAYVPESHADRDGHFPSREEVERVKSGVAILWASFFAVIGVALINGSQAAKAVQIASHTLH